MSEDTRLTVTRHRAVVPVRFRARLRYRWHRLRLGRNGRRVEDAFYRTATEAFVYGAYARRWSHRDLVEGRCNVDEYVTDLKADVDARLRDHQARKLRGMFGRDAERIPWPEDE